MIRKTTLYPTLMAVLLGGLVSCNPTATEGDKKAKEDKEAHNPATQVIPDEAKDLLGRWDLEVTQEGSVAPSWLEIKLSGYNTLVGAFVAQSGSSRPVSHILLQDGKFSFAIPPQWEEGTGDIVIEGKLEGGNLIGTIQGIDGAISNFKGSKAPYLKRTSPVTWGEPIALFNGKDLSGWKASNEQNNWEVKDGILSNAKAGANLITEQKFDDFKLQVEFRYPAGSNSGIYLRGRYELQIEDSPKDQHPGPLYFGAIYGFLSPNEMAALGPNEWQTYDVTLVGRLVTVVANGKTIISNQEIPGITGGALDSKEGEPGPLYIQGDHGPIEFRKISITPAK